MKSQNHNNPPVGADDARIARAVRSVAQKRAAMSEWDARPLSRASHRLRRAFVCIGSAAAIVAVALFAGTELLFVSEGNSAVPLMEEPLERGATLMSVPDEIADSCRADSVKILRDVRP